jgi:integrase
MIESRTLRTLLLFLYGTGALAGEALRLTQEDVDLKNDVVTIRNKRFGRVRHIPIRSRPASENATIFRMDRPKGDPKSECLCEQRR